PPASCKVAFTSSPDAAEVVLDGSVIGTTPFEHEGSCAAYQVTFRRDKYASLTEEVAAGATSLDVRLERPPFKVRVTSRPSGAVVKVGGENLGKTPVTITLPGFETTSIELVRGGKTTPHRVYAGKSGQKVHVKLRRR
ncbi:MAG: PEGA domain-containing protein, partial [Deltaproteobacteria bacterium]|nr:PEGA domain-containing protein [Kofleriaceae bacterium]